MHVQPAEPADATDLGPELGMTKYSAVHLVLEDRAELVAMRAQEAVKVCLLVEFDTTRRELRIRRL
jgi:hypothetical protein